MKKQKGIYLVPTKKQRFGLLYCDGENFKKLYSNSYAKELISIISTDSDAMQIVLSYVNQEPVIEKRYSPARAERIFTQNLQVVKIIRSINTILGLLLNAELSKIEKPSPDDRKGYEKAIDLQRKIYRDFGTAFQNAKVLANIYAELPCPLEEKPKHILEIDKQLLDHTFQETYYINRKNFLLLNLIHLNPNICLCQNCGELFVAKTKKKTLYCDRIQPDSNKTCSEIGPKNRAELQSTLFGFEDYGKAVERNYQRAKRTEEYYVKDKAAPPGATSGGAFLRPQTATNQLCGLCWARSGTYPIFYFARHGAKQGASGFLAAHRFNHQPDSQRETSTKRVAFPEVH